MLSLRMIIVAGLAGICLWGLFQLLDNLREPGLLRTNKAAAVKGCSSLDDHKDAARLCPLFLCQKALIDRKLVDLQAQLDVSVDRSETAGRVIAGRATNSGAQDRDFACTVVGLSVREARLLESGELEKLATGGETTD